MCLYFTSAFHSYPVLFSGPVWLRIRCRYRRCLRNVSTDASKPDFPSKKSLAKIHLSQVINSHNCIALYGRWVSGISRALHCDQPAPRHDWQSLQPSHEPPSSRPGTCQTEFAVERVRGREGVSGRGTGVGAERCQQRLKMCWKLLNPMTKTFHDRHA